MKKSFFSILPLVLIFSTCEKNNDGPNPNDPVNIPDTAFLYALIDEGVDSNGDSLISYGEAEAVDTLDVQGDWEEWWLISYHITDMTGIQAFTNLEALYCGDNDFGELDVSKNTKLKSLECHGHCALGVHSDGIMESLDVSNNTLLESLNCACQKIDSLDVTKNIKLKELDCGGNPFTYLDLSKNTELKTLKLHAAVNLTTLNISNNTKLTYIDLSWAKVLNEVCVWTLPFPPEGVSLDMGGECPNVYFTTDCGN